MKRTKHPSFGPPPLTGRQRAVELVKDLLIVILVCSAVYLAARTQLHTGLAPWIETLLGGEHAQQNGRLDLTRISDVVQPARAAVCLGVNENGEVSRYGVQYSDTLTNRLASATSGLVGEGLASARTPVSLSKEDWQRALRAPGIYLDYQGSVPLTALCQWLNDGVVNAALSNICAAQLVLADLGGETAVLCYKNEADGLYYAWETTVSCQGYFSSTLEPYTDNGARFAFELDRESYGAVSGELMVLDAITQPPVYQSVTHLDLNDDNSRDDLQQALLFRSQDYMVPDMWVSREEDTLRISAGGMVTYEGESASRYPVGVLANGAMDVSDLLETTHRLASDALTVWCGGTPAAQLALTEALPLEDGSWIVRYHYRLNGITLSFSDGEDAAFFLVKDGAVTAFTLRLRCYEDTGDRSPILRERQAAAALEALSAGQTLSLMLCYEDTGGSTIQAAWVAR